VRTDKEYLRAVKSSSSQTFFRIASHSSFGTRSGKAIEFWERERQWESKHGRRSITHILITPILSSSLESDCLCSFWHATADSREYSCCFRRSAHQVPFLSLGIIFLALPYELDSTLRQPHANGWSAQHPLKMQAYLSDTYLNFLLFPHHCLLQSSAFP
jgi:hypothetical protein